MASVPEMLESLKGMGIDPGRFTAEQLERIMQLASKVDDPANVTQELLDEVAAVLRPKKKYGKVPVNSPCPCGSGKKFKKCCRS